MFCPGVILQQKNPSVQTEEIFFFRLPTSPYEKNIILFNSYNNFLPPKLMCLHPKGLNSTEQRDRSVRSKTDLQHLATRKIVLAEAAYLKVKYSWR